MTVTYHKSHSFETKEGDKIEVISQLYQVGVYIIVNGDSSQQYNMTPKKIANIEKTLKKDKEKGKIKNLKFGNPITVTDKSGFWEEVKN